MFVVDSHVHLSSPDEWTFPARPDARRPGPGIGTLQHFEQQCAKNEISRGVAIQTVSMYGWDNRYTAYLARVERCVWGSCYPVEFWVPRTTQRQSLDVFLEELALDSDSRASILGDTANRLWFSDSVN